jgi:O-antigen ligase
MDDEFLTGPEGRRARSSHNTFMSLLVEQGVLGALMYVLLLFWIARLSLRLRTRMRRSSGLLPVVYTATVAVLGAITVGDLFVDYLKFEARVWFLALLMVLVKMDANQEQIESQQPKRPAGQATRAQEQE